MNLHFPGGDHAPKPASRSKLADNAIEWITLASDAQTSAVESIIEALTDSALDHAIEQLRHSETKLATARAILCEARQARR